MKIVETALKTKAVFSENGEKRYVLTKTWDEKKPRMAIIMLAPSVASGVELDMSTLLVLNNASRLGYGSVEILNLFARVNDFSLKEAEEGDVENLQYIQQVAESVDTIVYAAGVGKNQNKIFRIRQKVVLKALSPWEKKLHCLCNANGDARLQHPLSPAVRTWHLSSLKINELLEENIQTEKEEPKKRKKKIEQ